VNDDASGYCKYEESVVAATAAGVTLPAALADHVHSCAGCAAARETTTQLGRLVAASVDDPLPSAGLVRWKAARAERLAAARKADTVLRWSGRCGVAIPVMTTAALFFIHIQDSAGSNMLLLIGSAGLAGILVLSGIGLAIWRAAER
jgi:hypothetical protein